MARGCVGTGIGWPGGMLANTGPGICRPWGMMAMGHDGHGA